MTTQQTHTHPDADELPIDNARVIGSRQGRMDSFTSDDTPIDGPPTGDGEATESDKAEALQDGPTDE